ncbi:transglycosylase SLT domain-containing protein [Calidifontimicrobium sp. SYSU G02091]|uniref:transglycosylase SLT domain-containing protein n=1 Tax=Calidifontimicrobium sp. SYSU G02091 TaxID=2926421 RepID=UPI001F533547|nr:transglycosylase SLT domain-containing protein [Calidifontimicrobium sp. SYSU G02091]MCI1192676.1 transglycosylase SLT domain-containing protein [Calidifontimicrobium sp. SYSU G02091]
MTDPFRLLAALAAALALSACSTLPSEPPPLATAPAAASPDAAAVATATPARPAAAPVAPATPAAADPPAEAIDPLRPDRPVDLEAPGARTDLWQRVRNGFAVPDLDDELVTRHERWYASRPDYVRRMTERGGRYLFHIVEEVDRRGLPMELALLPFIESAFNPQALSSARASGIWQFMPATGRDFDLRQNLFRDDRRDVLASTRAALDYLTRLFNMFGDWHLALAAYNWGEGNVQRAIRRNEAAGLPTDYLSLRMPAETRNYVPKLQAVKNIVANPAAFGLALQPLENHPFFLAVPIERDIDVALVVELAGITAEEFHQLNPQLNKPVILAAGTPQVLLPYDNAGAFVRRLAAHRGPLASWTAWTVPRTVRPAEAAKLAGVSEAQLVQINRIPAGMLVKAGSTLLVPRSAQRTADVPPQVADNAVIALTPERPPLRRVVYRARANDTVASVARRFGQSAANVARWNDVSTKARFAPGATVIVYVPQTATAAAPRRQAASAGTTRSAAKAAPPPRAAKAPARRPTR